ncbi:hypothetical protein [Neobacillus massiliamazoniensis]|uniref:Uncharacterized protein n=1 Tax=Neobacillus massiliamazoniensis TaxID=1499688 RepID=A0A0U1P3L9_9BACI|nr:hypothetical protein [Neobacillus massiliamazoniensis]CRK84964.1 hypothetical protein BN000_05023 [Neobacillus massiliamazoniensis]
MESKIETVYILENPEKNIRKFATGYQLRYDDTIKEVFGVACMHDLTMMLQFNKSFQESICRKDGISESNITLNCIIRIASKDELHHLRKQLVEKMHQDSQLSQENENPIPCPFNSIIKLQEGIFKWDDHNSSYIPMVKGA